MSKEILNELKQIKRALTCQGSSSSSCCPETNILLEQIVEQLTPINTCTTTFSDEFLEDLTLIGETPENTKLITITNVSTKAIRVNTNKGSFIVTNNLTRETYSVFKNENLEILSIETLDESEFDGQLIINYKSITCENEEDGIYSFEYSNIYA